MRLPTVVMQTSLANIDSVDDRGTLAEAVRLVAR